MKIHQASEIFKDLLSETDKKSDKKIYQQLLGVLAHLKERDLTEEQLRAIEVEIGGLTLERPPASNLSHLKRDSRRFMKFPRDKLSFISEGHYLALGMGFGVAFSAAFGTIIEHFFGISAGAGIGMGMGMIVGMIIGIYMDKEAEKLNRLLISKLK